MPARYFDAQMLSVEKERSVALIELNGVNDVVQNLGSVTTYEVISGRGQFSLQFNDSQPKVLIPVEAGSTVTVPARVTYQDRGEELMMIATCEPPFDPRLVSTVEKSERLTPLQSVII